MSAETQARLGNLVKRALFALNAAQRVSKAVLGGKGIKDAVGSERALFNAHKRQSKESLKVAALLDAYVAQHGRIASWRHGPLTPTDRPHHVAADNHNFDILAGAPHQTGGMPGELPNCKCTFGRPIEGASMLK